MLLEKISRVLARCSQRAHQIVQGHPRSVTSSVVMLLMGFGVTAFGIVPMAPDASKLPQRWVTESIGSVNIEDQLDALADHSIQLFRSDVTRSSDTVDTLLRRLNVDDLAAAHFLRTDSTARKLLEGKGSKAVQVSTDRRGNIEEFVARYPSAHADQATTHFTRLTVHRVDGELQARVETAPLVAEVRMASGTIRTSLFAAADESRIPDPVSIQLVNMFSADIDFHRGLRKGDSFSLLYEALTADGQPITWNQAAGKVLAAEFINQGRSYSATWFQDSSGKGSYFDFNGQTKRRDFLASPLEFSRVTSGFSMRFHPILQTWKAHLGVDYAAPTGTSVRSVGDGVVEFAGWQSGYGNVVQIKHSQERSTLYAHLSRISVRKGERINQGATVGAVGATGWATGPHLHFEFRVKGQHQDPLLMAKAAETVALPASAAEQFAAVAKDRRQQLQTALSMPRSSSIFSE